MHGKKTNKIAVMLNDAFADWETGFLSASARDFFDTDVLHFSPNGDNVISEGGLDVTPSGAFADIDVAGLKALIVCGSANWSSPTAPVITDILRFAAKDGILIGVICAGTLTAARAGLFDDRRHTSNGLEWLQKEVPGYRGREHYQDVNEAVFDRGLISAPATAPAAFASMVLAQAFPGHANLAQTRAMLASAR